MSAPLPPDERERLSKLLALLDSPQAGERAAAIAAATRLLERRGMRWSEVLAVAPPAVRRRHDWRATIAKCLQRPGDLRRWEREFLESLTGFPKMSGKQRTVLAAIAERVLRRAAA
jgi:hypothetical protein